MNKPIPAAEFETPKVTTGPLPASRKIYSVPEAAPDLRVPLREIAVSDPNEPPLPVYDTTGPYTDPDAVIDVERGLPRTAHRMGEGARRRRGIRRPSDPAGRQRQCHRQASGAQFPQHAETLARAR